jgi:cytochrome c553
MRRDPIVAPKDEPASSRQVAALACAGRLTGKSENLYIRTCEPSPGPPGCRTVHLRSLALFTALALGAAAPAAPPPGEAAADHFERKVRPLLLARCVKCHGPDKVKGGLRIDSAAGLARGGEAGPVVLPGKPDESLLIEAVRQTGDLKMPPGARLKDQEIADLAAWVRAGAVWPGGAAVVAVPPAGARFTPEQKAFWAFQPVHDHPPPAVRATDWPTSPLDRFVLAKLEARGLSPAPRADRRTLIRRVTFDLTGLPPTPAEIDAFLVDSSPDAFARVVDRLLASPRYGERWGRHWLDVVRYADTTANDANAIMRYAWRYRDYVVGAFNRDKPYDQFLTEQLAGDLLPPTPDRHLTAERAIATGFLMLGPKALAETDKEQTLLDIADEQIDVVGRAFLGLTIGCARCHDHKFDPIPQVDYYSLAGILRGTEILKDRAPNASMWEERPVQQGPGEPPLVVMAPKEGKATTLRVHLRGNRFTLGLPAPRRFPQILAGEDQAPLTTEQSGRLELARWIAAPGNPLTARVMVNRIWQHHFGTGLVATADNFGARGEAPSHPELLDWLAARFVASGWSVKALHRLILLSSTYQMAGTADPRGLQADPHDRLLWRMPRRRLEAEALRDALLAVSGQLDRRMGGNDGIEVVYQAGEVIDAKRGFVVNRVNGHHACYQVPRRSLYLPVIRNALPDVLALFDAADPYAVTAVRNDTTVPAQALFLLNNPFVRQKALHFARSLLAEAAATDSERLRSAYTRALGRPPSADELTEATAFLARYATEARQAGRPEGEARLAAWQSYCQLLFCLNEFLYLD